MTWSEAYRTGHEIGTHYLGHFCGATGVNTWSTADWTSEITQFNEFITNWQKYNPTSPASRRRCRSTRR